MEVAVISCRGMKVRLLVKAKLQGTLHTGLLIDLDRNKVFRIRDDKLWELLQELSQNHEIDIKTPEDIEAVRPLVDLGRFDSRVECERLI